MSGDDDGAAAGVVASFAAGSRIAGYRLEKQVGQGGMAVVFRAHDEQLDRLVALKILAPALAGDAGFRRRFSSESRAAAAIDDPHIVPVFAAGEADGVLFIAMRYVAGGDAQSLLTREGPLPPDRLVAIISPVASALDAAHRAGLVHRDVKPSNMLLDALPGRPDHVYLSDFGLSKAATATSGLTTTGEVLGTLSYMAPEQVSGKPVDGRTDQYALACSAFELLTGAPPFRRDETMALLYAHLLEPPPQATSLRPGLPPAVDGVLSRALAKEPDDRYVTCGQFADSLRGALGFHAYRLSPAVTPAEADRPAETAQSATELAAPAAPQHGELAGAMATTLNPLAATVGAPATEATTLAGTGAAPTAVDSVPATRRLTLRGGGGPPRARRRRSIAVAVFVVAAAAGLTAWLLPGGGSRAGSAGATTAVPISVKSAQPAANGDVYVVYLGGKSASGEVYGDIGKAASGEVVRLYAQQFPYKSPPAPAGSVILHPAAAAAAATATASYEFQVAPALATRYRVELFRSGTASTPLGTSSAATIYVVDNRTTQQGEVCSRPVCHVSLQVIELVPPSALAAEMSKLRYVYFGINLSPTTEPAVPQYLTLGAGNGQVTAPHRIAANEFSFTATFSFPVGNDAYQFDWRTCTKATEAADGIELPGSAGCGTDRILTTGDLW